MMQPTLWLSTSEASFKKKHWRLKSNKNVKKLNKSENKMRKDLKKRKAAINKLDQVSNRFKAIYLHHILRTTTAEEAKIKILKKKKQKNLKS